MNCLCGLPEGLKDFLQKAKEWHVHKVLDQWVAWMVVPWMFLSIFNGEAAKWSFVEVKKSVSFEREEDGVRRKGRVKDEDRTWKKHVYLFIWYGVHWKLGFSRFQRRDIEAWSTREDGRRVTCSLKKKRVRLRSKVG